MADRIEIFLRGLKRRSDAEAAAVTLIVRTFQKNEREPANWGGLTNPR
ncbi:MAG: hypothetical protein QOJ40_1313 [Verrucomicrobiota bacterium]|jgi:hypothetical protein